MSVLLPLSPGTLPEGICYPSEQARLNAYAEVTNAILDGMAFYNFGPDKPTADLNTYPWLRTTDGRWYFYSGGWLSPNPEQSPYVRRIFIGSTVNLQTYDGGDTDTHGPSSGPMWEVDTAFEGRFPLAAGTLQPSGTVVAVNSTGGVDEHTLDSTEVPATAINPLDSSGNPTGDKTVQKSGSTFGFSYQNNDFVGSGGGGDMTNVPLAVAGGGQPHTNTPPYYAVYIIKRTSRVNYKVP